MAESRHRKRNDLRRAAHPDWSYKCAIGKDYECGGTFVRERKIAKCACPCHGQITAKMDRAARRVAMLPNLID